MCSCWLCNIADRVRQLPVHVDALCFLGIVETQVVPFLLVALESMVVVGLQALGYERIVL